MGHGKVYRKLGRKLDSLPSRAPWNEAFYNILKELYTPQEAEVVIKMPYGLSDFDQIASGIRMDQTALRKILEGLCEKGLVFDFLVEDRYRYTPSPLVIGIFEMTMMRTRGKLNSAEWARLFDGYDETEAFYKANCNDGKMISVMRTLPHEDAIEEADPVEVLDYEKATSIIEDADRFAIGLCSCRHEKLHAGKRKCNIPLETCSSFGSFADALIRHGMAKEVSKTEMLENVARAKERKLVLTADNVQKNVHGMCQCCGCCCNLLLGVSKHGYPDAIVTSSYISQIDKDKCIQCGKCVKACPILAIEMISIPANGPSASKFTRIDESICIGCGVCALVCNKRAIGLVKRKQRVLHPETTFERIILASLERGTLQYQLFEEPDNITHKFLRGFFGGFLRLPPVKQALMSDLLRSKFLSAMKSGVQKQDKGWILNL